MNDTVILAPCYLLSHHWDRIVWYGYEDELCGIDSVLRTTKHLTVNLFGDSLG